MADLSDKLRPVAEALLAPTQCQGVQALGDWFARQAESSRVAE